MDRLRPSPSPPIAAKRRAIATHHGVELVDDYAWLRAQNWQEVMRKPDALEAEIRTYLEAENAYCEAQLADTAPLREALFVEMKARIKEDDSSVPAPDGPFEYYVSTVTAGQYPRIGRRPRPGHGALSTDPQVAGDHILLDGNLEADGAAYWQLGGFAHSPDHRLLAYAVDDKGSELFTIRIRDLASGRDLEDRIPDTRGQPVWSADSCSIFYVRLDTAQRPQTALRHDLGTSAAADPVIYEEADDGFMVSVGKTQSGDFVLVDAHDHETSEVRLINAHAPAGAPRLVALRQTGHEYAVEHEGDHLVITTNSEGAIDFRIMTAPLADPSIAGWQEIVAHRPGRLILETVAFKRHIARLERENGLPRIVIRSLTSGAEHTIEFAEEAYSLSLSSGYEFDTDKIRFTYSSMTTPAEVYDYDMTTRERTLRKRQEVPSGHNPAHYVTRRLQAPASDGAQIPVTLLYARDTPLDGSAPVLLYGYGAYGISIPAAFSTNRLSLVDRGFIYAIAHIRGGKDKGYGWYLDGKREHKTNTFSDFIAAGLHLIEQGLTRKGQIVAQGGSAGGMLMGAVANMSPELFLGIIADVPFVDVLNTMLDETLPLTPPEWPEWGNPITSKADFERIRSYSPYDNVTSKAYPHIYAFAGLTDPRVTYWEPAKWIAKLREHKVGNNLLLLKTNMAAGHGGASGRFEALREIAFDYAFALKVAGKMEARTKTGAPADGTP